MKIVSMFIMIITVIWSVQKYDIVSVFQELHRGVESTWKPYLSKSTDTVKITPLQVTSHQFHNSLSKSIRVSDFNRT